MIQLIQIKNQVQNRLERFFPEYLTVFKNWTGRTSLSSLKHFPLPEYILAQGVTGIIPQWRKEVKRAAGIKRATQLVEAAQRSIGLTHGLKMSRQELKILFEQYELYMRQVGEIEGYIQELLATMPGAQAMIKIKGIGWVTVPDSYLKRETYSITSILTKLTNWPD